jgi:hypothetical protein
VSIAAIEAEVARRRRIRQGWGTAGVVVLAAALAASLPFAISGSRQGTARLSATPTPQASTTGQPSPTARAKGTPTLRLSWSGQPHDGATATVTGAGFSPGASVQISPCPPNSECTDRPIATARARGDGTFTVGVTAHLVNDDGSGSSWMCAQTCKFVAESQTGTFDAETVTFDLVQLPPADEECSVRTLQVGYVGPGPSAPGRKSALFRVRNTGQSPCWVYGPGGLGGLVDQTQLPSAAWSIDQSPPAWPPRAITLQAGDTAQFTITKPACVGPSVTSSKLYFGVSPGPIVIIEVPIPSGAQAQLALCSNVSGATANLPAPENVLTVSAYTAG